MYPEVFKTKEIFKNNEFHSKLFDASVANYFELNNPIRFNNFCYSIRELIREKLDQESPDSEVIKSVWYIQNKDGKPYRSDKIRYYITKGISNENLPEGFLNNLKDVQSEFTKLMGIMNKYTHINSDSFGIELFDGDKWFRNVLKILVSFVNLLNELEKKIQDQLLDKIYEDIQQKLFDELPNEIDVLSTHSSIDEIDNVNIEIESMDSEYIYISGECDVGVELQYGSESDNRGDENTAYGTSYPMDFKIVIEINNLEEREYELGEIDTSSFYGADA